MNAEKRLAAERAVEYVQDGMVVGLGSGSTAAYAVKKLGERVRNGLSIRGIPTSESTRQLAEAEEIALTDFKTVSAIDLTIDGADEVDPDLNLIKGGGAALLREKIVSAASRENVIIVDSSKTVKRLGAFPLPVEVIPSGWQTVARRIDALGGNPELRLKDGSPLVTDQGHWILDCAFGTISDAVGLELTLNNLPGGVENGLFIKHCTRLVLAQGQELVIRERTP
ncbi:MAG TPA: ribose-5-phosphate isomerase RpiA [Deltaproteobacteria bacterium]|nr:ribose-5-phosphate isomerase RpiA [Deltaproteobacteria bacterium]